MQSPVWSHGRPSVAVPPVTQDVAPVVRFDTSQVSVSRHPHCGSSPHRLFGGTVSQVSFSEPASTFITSVGVSLGGGAFGVFDVGSPEP